MDRLFEQELDDLRQKLLTMAGHAETALKTAVEALVTRSDETAGKARAEEQIIDRLEIEIDETAVTLLSKAPLASDLRLILVAMKVGQNLERVGDEANKIAKRVLELNPQPPLRVAVDFPRLARLALDLLKAALDSFVAKDPAAARALIARDKEVDALNREIHAILEQAMTLDSQAISRGLKLMIISKSLERVADHAKNVAEEVVYLCEAEDIRHHNKPSHETENPRR
jgi:phosphate transport system protein